MVTKKDKAKLKEKGKKGQQNQKKEISNFNNLRLNLHYNGIPWKSIPPKI